jgi:signal transduction histidine kinase
MRMNDQNLIDFIYSTIRSSENNYVAVFNKNGKLLDANRGFMRLINNFGLHENPKNIFLTPKFENIIEDAYQYNTNKKNLYVTVGNLTDVYLSLYFTIKCDDDNLFFFGEINSKELGDLNKEYILMHNEVQDLNRKLTKNGIELEKTLEELRKANRQLKEVNEQKNRFIGIAAHELRGPLGSVQSLLDLYIDENEEVLDEESISTFEIIIQTLDNTLNVVNDFLSVSIIESGVFSINLESIDYNEFLKSVINLNRTWAEKKNIEISLDYLSDTAYIYADRGKLSQVLNNLISNGLKYSEPGSHLKIKVINDGEYLTTSVIDQGQGISEDEISNLFNYFSKTSSTTTAGESSTGIGLAISKKIIEAHEGIIGLESEINKGSNFYFKLKKQE